MTEESAITPKEAKKFLCYHGTSEISAQSILKTNFNISQKNNDWLGYGVYFFIEGISCPIANAKEWATYKAYDKKTRRYLYHRYSILLAHVEGTNILDTNKPEDIKSANSVRDLLIESEKFFSIPRNKDFQDDNRIMWNLIADFLKLDIIIHNLYIKNKKQRMSNINSNIPNTTVMCVKDATHIKDIEIIEKGYIKR